LSEAGLKLPSTLIARADAVIVQERARRPRLFPLLVQKMRQALPFLATIENDAHGMGIFVISIRAALRFPEWPTPTSF
jgi:hypothetical protein